MLVDCAVCGESIQLSPSRFKNSVTGKFTCSNTCRASLSAVLKEFNCECYICKMPMKIKPSYLSKLKNQERITCSLECSKLERSERFTGEGNHQFGLLGELNASHISDLSLTNYGYLKGLLPSHPASDYAGKILVHRLIFEEFLKETGQYNCLELRDGRYILRTDLVIHHKNGNKLDNRIDNLDCMSLEEHTSLHHTHDVPSNPNGNLIQGSLYKKHLADAGFDVTASETITIPPKSSALIATGLKVDIPLGYVGLLWSRSGLSVKHSLEVGAGCIDSGYSGEVKVHLYNHGAAVYTVIAGDRIAQLLTFKVELDCYEGAIIEDETRNENGFGSTDGAKMINHKLQLPTDGKDYGG